MTKNEEIEYINDAWKKIQNWVKENTSFTKVKSFKYVNDRYFWEALEVYPNGDCSIRRNNHSSQNEGILVHKNEEFIFGDSFNSVRWYPSCKSYDGWMNNDVFEEYRKMERGKYIPPEHYDNLENCYDLIRSLIDNWNYVKNQINEENEKENNLKTFVA